MKKLLLATAAVVGLSGAAQAVDLGPLETTEINQSGSFNQFSGPGTLTSVTVTVTGLAQSIISLTNNGSQTETASATGNVQLFFESSIASLDTALGSGSTPTVTVSLPTGVQSIGPGATFTSPLLTGSDTATFTITGAGLAGFSGEGSFTISCFSLSGLSLVGGGGNIASSQSTQAQCSATVEFNSRPDVVPTPAALAVFGLGLLGLGLTRVRRRA